MIKIANAPCSWGVLEFGLDGKTAGYAQVLDEMKEAGYAGTELGDWGFMPADPAQLKAELAKRILLCSAHSFPWTFQMPPRIVRGKTAHYGWRSFFARRPRICRMWSSRMITERIPCVQKMPGE